MPKVNVYLPDNLAGAVRGAGIPVSTVCQRALEAAVQQATALREGVRKGHGTLPPGIQLPLRATPRLIQAVLFGYDEARSRDHGFVGTEHLLLGMLNEGENLGVRVIASLEVQPGDLRAELEGVMQEALGDAPSGEPDLTPRARHALDLAANEAGQLRHTYLGCEHLLLGLIRETEGMAGQVLRMMGLDIAVTRRAIVSALTGFDHARANQRPSSESVVEELLRDMSARLARLESRLRSGEDAASLPAVGAKEGPTRLSGESAF